MAKALNQSEKQDMPSGNLLLLLHSTATSLLFTALCNVEHTQTPLAGHWQDMLHPALSLVPCPQLLSLHSGDTLSPTWDKTALLQGFLELKHTQNVPSALEQQPDIC